MKRPVQHIIADKGITQVRTAFESLGWTVEPITNDYGLDLYVEVFVKGESTGVTFKVQVKSSESTAYSQGHAFVTEPVSKANARYWCVELKSPIVLIHADVASGKTYWTLPQLESSLERSLKQNDPGTISIRIPVANQLPGTVVQLLDALSQVETVLAVRSVNARTIPEFLQPSVPTFLRQV